MVKEALDLLQSVVHDIVHRRFSFGSLEQFHAVLSMRMQGCFCCCQYSPGSQRNSVRTGLMVGVNVTL